MRSTAIVDLSIPHTPERRGQAALGFCTVRLVHTFLSFSQKPNLFTLLCSQTQVLTFPSGQTGTRTPRVIACPLQRHAGSAVGQTKNVCTHYSFVPHNKN